MNMFSGRRDQQPQIKNIPPKALKENCDRYLNVGDVRFEKILSPVGS